MKRGGPLRRSGPPARRSPLAKESSKRKADRAKRRALPVVDRCEVADLFRAAGVDAGPCGGGLHWHERRKRSSAGSIVNRANLVGSCDRHNDYIEDHPDEARRLGSALVVREGDQEYWSLGRRGDEQAGEASGAG